MFVEQPIVESGSKGWVAIFPIAIVGILVGLGVWKKKEVKTFWDNFIKKSGR